MSAVPEASVEAPQARRTALTVAFHAVVTVGGLALLLLTLPPHRDEVYSWPPVFFALAVVVVDLIPVPAWGGLQLSLSFPILLGVAILYPAPVAGLITLVGSADPRELRREVTFLKAVFNRTQMALSIYAGAALFHRLATVSSPWPRMVPAIAVVVVTAYSVNTLLVASQAALARGISVGRVLAKMHGARPYEFLLSYLGLGLFGAVIARFFLVEGAWSVIAFLAPLVFARQMHFRNRALADQLTEQNVLLAEQAERLTQLLEKEHRTVKELRELNRMKEEFVAVVSHELRTPVTALIGYAKTLRQQEFAADSLVREEFLERMERQGDRLRLLIENLLSVSNLGRRQMPLSLGQVLVEDLAREVLEGLSSHAERVRTNLPADLPVLLTDRHLLGRVLANLLDNALKYSPPDSPCELGARADHTDIAFWVRDEGVGIPLEEMERIFDRFYQVDSSSTRSFPGAGLGLSLVKELTEVLGGTIEAESVPGEGSTFTVRLPVRHPDLEAQETAAV